MNNSTIKKVVLNYLGISLRACIPIPVMVAVLSFFKLEQDTILIVAFLCSIIIIEWLHFKKEKTTVSLDTNTLKNKNSLLPYDLSFRETDPLMYGAIAAKANSDDLMNSLELETKASEVYKWCRL